MRSLAGLSRISHRRASSAVPSGAYASRYDSDIEQEDLYRSRGAGRRGDRGLLGALAGPSRGQGKKQPWIKKYREDQGIDESRESMGSFSDLVLEQYDKMNLNPALGRHSDSDSGVGHSDDSLQNAPFRGASGRPLPPVERRHQAKDR